MKYIFEEPSVIKIQLFINGNYKIINSLFMQIVSTHTNTSKLYIAFINELSRFILDCQWTSNSVERALKWLYLTKRTGLLDY